MELIEREAAIEVLEHAAEHYSRIDDCTEHTILQCISTIKKVPTIDPIRAAGGCRCGECKYWKRAVNTPDRQFADWGFCEKFLDSDSVEEINTVEKDFCSYGEPREAQDNG